MAKAKPFIKWVGGKTQLLEQLEAHLPADFDVWSDVTYIEPFVGGGAMLFYMLQRHPQIRHAVINDINPDLTTCYAVVRDTPHELIEALGVVEHTYHQLPDEEARKEFFLTMRAAYNRKPLSPIENTVKFFFLNRTCFNGLYRVNKKGAFNVPFGRYAHPQICDAATILADSELLQRVDILHGDFEETFSYARGNTLFYFDPPYRPLSCTSNFNDYAKEAFNDEAQIRLKEYCDRIDAAGFSFLLSNSDSKDENEQTGFFDRLYQHYPIVRVRASRSINSNALKRGKITEILVRNFEATKALCLRPLSLGPDFEEKTGTAKWAPAGLFNKKWIGGKIFCV